MQPIILYEGNFNQSNIDKIRSEQKIWQERDIYVAQLTELYEIDHPAELRSPEYPQLLDDYLKDRSIQMDLRGSWVYFPWSGELIHMLGQVDFDRLRTNRNKNLINTEEQAILSQKTIGITGLSIGNSMATSLVYTGVVGALKLADFDKLSTTNLNRIKAGVGQVSVPKIDICTQQIYEANPYIKIYEFDSGLNVNNIGEFMGQAPKLDLIFEAIDDFEMKIRIRLTAKELGIPVVMLTNLGDSVLIDIERYDLDPNLEVFNGLVGDTVQEILSKPLTEADKQKYAVSIVGRENVPPRAIRSVMEIGKTLVGRPQLMSTVAVGGGLAAYIARKLFLGDGMASGRSKIAFNDLIK